MARRILPALLTTAVSLPLGCAPQATMARASSASSGEWVAGPARSPRAGEALFTDSLALLRDPEDGNRVPGPDGLVALMKPDRQHHPRLYLARESAPESLSLLIDRYATQPRWAPSGRRLACTVWKSRRRPWELCIIAPGKADTSYPLPQANAVRYRWAPDARRIAVNGTLEGGSASILYVVDTKTGVVTTLDTMSVYSEYEMDWSPDSKVLAASRPVRIAGMDDVTESEIWVFDLEGRRSRVVSGNGCVNGPPRWVDNRRLLFTRQCQPVAGSKTLVMDLALKKGR